MHSSVLHHEYLGVYISANNGSVVKTIPEIDRKKSTKMELLNSMFSLRYKSKLNLIHGGSDIVSHF